MPRAGAAGLSMYYELAGAGTAVVFISGLTADHAGWKLFQVPAFTAAGYQCLVFDNRDVGQTGDSPQPAYGIPHLAADTMALMDHLGLERADAVKEMGKKFGVTMTDIQWTMGAYDVVARFEASDEASMSSFALAVAMAGNIRGQTLRSYSKVEMEGILKKLP